MQGLLRLKEPSVLLRCRKEDVYMVESILDLAKEEYATKTDVHQPEIIVDNIYLPSAPSSNDPHALSYISNTYLHVPLESTYTVLTYMEMEESYYHNQILPSNSGHPLDLQKLRCRVNFSGLRFTSQIEEFGRWVVNILRKNGPFLVLHLRYEMDMLAFSGCTQGCNDEEVEELTRMRYPYP